MLSGYRVINTYTIICLQIEIYKNIWCKLYRVRNFVPYIVKLLNKFKPKLHCFINQTKT